METVDHSSKESMAFDFDQATLHLHATPYIRERAERADRWPHDPIPLFLSDPLSEPEPPEFAPLTVRTRSRLVPRTLAAVLAASAIASLIVVFQSDIGRLLVVNAKASMAAVTDQATALAAAPAVRQVALQQPARAADPTAASADTRDVPMPATPSREAIATAYQSALQAQSPAAAPVAAPPVAPPPAKMLDADTLAALMTRAKGLMAVGDIVAARLLLERAATAQDATAAFMLAQTYDPAVLGTKDTRSITADAAAARDWYEKAAQLGSAEARQRLTQLQN
jgi:hypothetical protein